MDWKDYAKGRVRLYDAPVLPVHIPVNGKCSCGEDPCEKSPGKHPRTLHGWKDATRDVAQIERWCRQFPITNWAMPTGEISGICLLDIDPRNDGLRTFNELFPKGLPDTFIVQSGGGGFHYYYLYDAVFARSEPRLAKGIEFLSNGHYVLIPPSLHISGNQYEVYADLPVAPLPEELKAILRQQKEKPERNFDMNWKEPIFEGGRNNALASLTGKLFHIGLDFPVVYPVILQQNDMYCSPPLERAEVKGIVMSIAETDKRNKEKKAKAEADRAAKQQAEQAKKVPLRFNLIDYKTLMMNIGNQPMDWIIDDWLPKRTTGFIIADPQAWKSWFAYLLGYSIASGEPFLGRYPVKETGPVIHLQQEDDLQIYATRMRAITQKPYGDPNEVHLDLPIYHPANIDEDGKILPGTLLNFTDPESVYAFERDLLIPKRPLLVTIDPFYTLLPAKDNFVEAPFHLQIIKTWARTYDTAFLIVHHMNKGKPGTRLRDNIFGSQLLNAWQETSYAFELTDDPNKVMMEKHFKNRPGHPDMFMSYRFDDMEMLAGVDVEPKKKVVDNSEGDQFDVDASSARYRYKGKGNKKDPTTLDVNVKTQDEIARCLELCSHNTITTWSQFIHLYDPNIPMPGNNLTRFSKRLQYLGFVKLNGRICKPDPHWYDPEAEERQRNGTGKKPRS